MSRTAEAPPHPAALPSVKGGWWRDVAILGCLQAFQFVWLTWRIDVKVALVNLLPTLVFFGAWTLFVNRSLTLQPLQRVCLLLLPLLLGLRLAWTVSPVFEALNWLLWLVIVALIARHLWTQFPVGERPLVWLTLVLVLCNTVTHLGLDSPYTYTFRLVNGLASAYTGVDDNQTWECAYEDPAFAVHCDARHFIASERIFNESDYDPSFSVVLQRFQFGYLNSLLGLEGHRWYASLCVNVVFWLLACVCIYRICVLLRCDRRTAGLSMLCCASAWGFVGMVAQPEPYLMAFAYAPIVLWATLELIADASDARRNALLLIIITSVVVVYDAYQLVLTSLALLVLRRKYALAAGVFVGQLALSAFWRLVTMRMVLGTEGNLPDAASGVSNFRLDLLSWWHAVSTFIYPEIMRFALRGVQAYLYGNLLIPALAAWFFIAHALWKTPPDDQRRPLAQMLLWLNLCVLASSLFVAPQMFLWSPGTGMQPRLAAYSLPINLIALVVLSLPLLKRFAWLLPALLFVVANIDVSGLASVALFFDYGRLEMVWK